MSEKMLERIQELEDRLNSKKYKITMFLYWVIWFVDDSYLLPEEDEFITVSINDEDKMTMISTKHEDIEKFNRTFDVKTIDEYLINTAIEFLDTEGFFNYLFFDNLYKDLRKLSYRLYVSEGNEDLGKEAVKKYIISYISKDSLSTSLFECLYMYTPNDGIKRTMYKTICNEGAGYGERLFDDTMKLDNKSCFFTLACDVLHEVFNIILRILEQFDINFKDVFDYSRLMNFCNTYYEDNELSKTDDNRQNNVPFQSQIEPPQPQLPAELDNEQARKYFDLAVEKGYMTIENGKYTWKETPAKFGYFASRVFEQPRPIAELERYFGFSKLASAITQAEYSPKRADKKAWINKMNDDFSFNIYNPR